MVVSRFSDPVRVVVRHHLSNVPFQLRQGLAPHAVSCKRLLGPATNRAGCHEHTKIRMFVAVTAKALYWVGSARATSAAARLRSVTSNSRASGCGPS